MSSSTKERVRTMLEILVTQLYENEIDSVTASFAGSCDSGTIDSFEGSTLDDEPITAAQLAAIVLHGFVPETAKDCGEWGEWIGGKFQARNFLSKPVTLLELAENVIYAELEMAHGGWEINAGSNGNVTVYARKDKTGRLQKVSRENIIISIDYHYDEDEDEDYDYDESEV